MTNEPMIVTWRVAKTWEHNGKAMLPSIWYLKFTDLLKGTLLVSSNTQNNIQPYV